ATVVDIGPPQGYCLSRTPEVEVGTADKNCRASRSRRTRPEGVASSTRGIQQYNRVTEGKEQNAIRIARARKQSARVPQDPGLEGGPRSRIRDPRSPALPGGPADKGGRRSRPVDGVEGSGPGCRTAPGPPDASPERRGLCPLAVPTPPTSSTTMT